MVVAIGEARAIADREDLGVAAAQLPVHHDAICDREARLVGERHLKLRVRQGRVLRDAIWFGHTEALAEQGQLAYRLSLDEYQGQQRVQMIVEAFVS